jgi:hypothetical protein
MNYDVERIDEVTLALLWLTVFKYGSTVRTWKSHDWDVLDRLCVKGYISNPKSQAKSVLLTEAGQKRSQELFEKYFGTTS